MVRLFDHGAVMGLTLWEVDIRWLWRWRWRWGRV